MQFELNPPPMIECLAKCQCHQLRYMLLDKGITFYMKRVVLGGYVIPEGVYTYSFQRNPRPTSTIAKMASLLLDTCIRLDGNMEHVPNRCHNSISCTAHAPHS